MSDFPFSIPRRGDADVVNGVSYAGTTLTLTRAEGSDLTTTIATSDPTKIENGTSKMEIASADGACVFTPAGLTAKTTTFAADGDIITSGNVGIGDDAPDAPLQIKGDGTNSSSLRIESTNAAGAGYMYIQRNTDGDSYILTESNHPLILGANNQYSQLYLKGDGNVGINDTAPSQKLDVIGNIIATGTITPGSDDRIKTNEKLIVNATETLSKLTPQIYDKYENMDLSGSFQVESGLIAQEVYYNAPELRHLVRPGKDTDASGNQTTPTPDEMDLSGVDIGSDPDYGSHGWSIQKASSLNYNGLIPYLIKSNQEMAERLAALENK